MLRFPRNVNKPGKTSGSSSHHQFHTSSAMLTSYPLFPSLSFFPWDIVQAKFLLSPESRLPLGAVDYLKALYNQIKGEFTWDNITSDFKTFLLLLVSSQCQQFIYGKLLHTISPPRKVYSGKLYVSLNLFVFQ